MKAGILFAALIVVGGGAIHLSRQLEASRQQVANLQAQVRTAAVPDRRQLARDLAPPVLLDAQSPNAGQSIAVQAASPTPSGDSAVLAETIAAINSFSSPSAESKARLKASMTATMPLNYPDVGKAVGLSPEEVDRLFDLLFEQSLQDAQNGVGDANSRARDKQAHEEEIASLLGGKYEKWQEYKSELPARRHVQGLASELVEANLPLHDEQLNALMPALISVESRNEQDRGSQAFGGFYNRNSPEANQNRLHAAAAYLTPQQMEVYKKMLERSSRRETALRERTLSGG